jgi:hypothetical protein
LLLLLASSCQQRPLRFARVDDFAAELGLEGVELDLISGQGLDRALESGVPDRAGGRQRCQRDPLPIALRQLDQPSVEDRESGNSDNGRTRGQLF